MIVRRFPLSVVCVVAAVILAVILPLGVAYGGLNIPSETIFSVLLGNDLGAFFSLEPASNPMTKIIIDLRLPRMVLAAIVGSGLAIVGALLQTATRNDLADPFYLDYRLARPRAQSS